MGKNYTVDNNTYASNPGNATLNPLVWVFHDWKRVGTMSLLLIVSVLLSTQVSQWFMILMIVLFAVNLAYWVRQKEHFQSGDSNGGLVVSINPTLVAVTTDLTKGIGDYPVVKIVEYKTLKKVQLGDRIATVALYTSSGEEDPHWIDFNPVPLSFATSDKSVFKMAMDSYDKQQWHDLENRLKEIEKPYKAGLYKVELNNSDWKHSDDTRKK